MEQEVTKNDLIEAQMELEYCITEKGPNLSNGSGSYYLNILDSISNEVVWRLYMLDSGCEPLNAELGEYDWIHRDQIQWYIEESKNIKENYNKIIPALAFFHIPLPEYNDVWESKKCFGNKGEEVCCPKLNSGMFTTMLEMGDVNGVFVGHDHYNDYYGNLHGITLGYGRATGGRTQKDNPSFIHGARVIEIDTIDNYFDTWIRLWNGEIITQD